MKRFLALILLCFNTITFAQVDIDNKKNIYKKKVKNDYKKLVLTYDKLFEKALDYNFDIKEIENQKKVFKEEINFTKLGYLPKLELSYNVNQLSKDAERDEFKYKQYKNSVSINMNMNIYDFNTRLTKIDILKKDLQIKDLEICDIKIKSALKLLDLYVEINKSRETINYFSRLYNEYNNIYKMKERLFEKGLIGSLDVINEKIKISNAENKINEEKNKLNYYISILEHETGIFLLDNMFLEPISSGFKFEKKDLESNNIQKRIIDEKKRKIYKEIKYFENSSMPTFDFYYNNEFYNEQDEKLELTSDYDKRDYSLGFNLKWSFNNIFNSKYEKNKKYLELQKNRIIYNRFMKKYKSDFNNKYLSILNFDTLKKIKVQTINNINDEIEANRRLHKQGLDYKYKIIESKIKLLAQEYELKIKNIDNNKNKKYLSILFERENTCTHL